MTKCDYCKKVIDSKYKIHIQCMKKRNNDLLPYFIHDEVYLHDYCLLKWVEEHYGEKECT